MTNCNSFYDWRIKWARSITSDELNVHFQSSKWPGNYLRQTNYRSWSDLGPENCCLQTQKREHYPLLFCIHIRASTLYRRANSFLSTCTPGHWLSNFTTNLIELDSWLGSQPLLPAIVFLFAGQMDQPDTTQILHTQIASILFSWR